MKIKGVSVIIKTEEEFNKIKEILEEALYVDFVPQMKTTLTAIVLFYSDPHVYSTGSVGAADYQKMAGCLLIPFKQFIENYES